MSDERKRKRLKPIQAYISSEELRAIDDYRLAKTINSRTAAVKTLLRKALQLETPNPSDTRDGT